MSIKEEIVYAVLKGTWISPIYVAMGTDGLVAVKLGGQEATFRDWIQQLTRFRFICDQDTLNPVLDQFREFLNGERLKFDLPIDWSNLSPFQRAVLQATTEVPPGRVVSSIAWRRASRAFRLYRDRSARSLTATFTPPLSVAASPMASQS